MDVVVHKTRQKCTAMTRNHRVIAGCETKADFYQFAVVYADIDTCHVIRCCLFDLPVQFNVLDQHSIHLRDPRTGAGFNMNSS